MTQTLSEPVLPEGWMTSLLASLPAPPELLSLAEPLSLEKYAQACAWVESQKGAEYLREKGRELGRRLESELRESGQVGLSPMPQRLLEALRKYLTLKAPQARGCGLEILEQTDRQAKLRLTHNIHCALLEVVLVWLLEKAPVLFPKVTHCNCRRNNQAYCEFEVQWLKAQARVSLGFKAY